MMLDKEKTTKIIMTKSSKKECEILESVLGQLSDGIWENSPRMQKYWENIDVEYHEKLNCSIIYFYDWRFRWEPKALQNGVMWFIINFLKNKIKQVVQEEKKDNNDSTEYKWKDTNNKVLDYMGYKEEITVSDCVKLYKKLKSML